MPRSRTRPVTLVAVATVLAACADPTDDAAREGALHTDAYAPSAAERAELVAALQTVFDALGRGDGDLLRQVMDPEVRMVSTETRADGTSTSGSSTLDGLIERIESAPEPLIERMWNPEVRIQGAIATIWTPYDFYSGDTFSHCGVDVATLMRGQDGWRIVALEWSRAQPPACAMHPEGPPRS